MIMSIIPQFLVQRVYKKGSLRQCDDGVEFDLKNLLGPGVISGLNFVQINGETFSKEFIKFFSQGFEHCASDLSEANPISFRLGQEGTLLLQEAKCLKEGLNKIIIEFLNPEAGKIQVELTDNVSHA